MEKQIVQISKSICATLIIIIGFAIPMIIIPQEAKGVAAVTVSDKEEDGADYPSITAAIAGAEAGSHIYVLYGNDGNYWENILIDRPLWIIGDDDQVNIIGYDTEPAVTISYDGVHLEDITIRIYSSGEKDQPGIKIEADYCTISNVDVINCYVGIELAAHSDYNTIEDCFFDDNDYASLVGTYADYNTIHYNYMRDNDEYGIIINSCDDNIIKNNYFKNSDNYAVYLQNCVRDEIYYNNFEDNRNDPEPQCQAYDDGGPNSGTEWDDGSEEGGNYWSDKPPEDETYEIDGGSGIDNHPKNSFFNAGPRE